MSRQDRGKRSDLIYGRQPALETLRAGRRTCHRLLTRESAKLSKRGTPDRNEVMEMAIGMGLFIEQIDRAAFGKLVGDVNHQGVALEVSPYPYVELEELLSGKEGEGRAPLLLILDHLQDPQNFGSIVRTAEAVDVDGIIIPSDRAVGVTAAVVRASAGASEHTRIARVTNLVRAMKALKDRGFWLAGLDISPEAKLCTEADCQGSLGLVLGSEGRGLGRLVRETCDFLIRLPQYGRVASLNAGVAAAIALYEIRRQQQNASEAAPQT